MKFLKRNGIPLCLMVNMLLIISCATYYEKSLDLMNAVYVGKFDEAEKIMDQPFWRKKKKNILLYYLNKGTVLFMNNKPEESNKVFQQADFYIEDFQKNYTATAISFLTNPNVEPYYGEGFEQILLHYYTTFNYMQLGKLDDALVECKRMQQKLTRITDYYKGKNKYKRDAFAHNLLGMIYDAQRDYNNAFIAYRNAYEIYSEDYVKMLKTNVPLQLKKDMIRTASLTGFSQEARAYEEEFNLKYEPEDTENGSLVFFWNNGMGPVKDEWSINFTVVPQGNGWVTLVNWDLNLSFPFYVGEDKNKSDLSRLKFVRVAFPKYITRNLLYQSGTLSADSFHVTTGFDMAENINAIAYRSLEDRMLKEMGEALIRVALKQAAEAELRKQNEGWGVALSALNALTEQADTRNWQLLPYSINYARISLPAGSRTVKLEMTDANGVVKKNEMVFNINKGKTTLGCFQSLQFSGYSNLNNPFFQ